MADTRSLELEREADIRALRERYLSGLIGLEEFEAGVARALHDEPAQYASRLELHIYNAPRDHQLHIHL